MVVMDYRTRDGLADYGFSIEYISDVGWRAYVIFRPFSHGPDQSQDLPYQAIDDKGRRYVDWLQKLNSLGEAKTVAGLWAELVDHYRRDQAERALYIELIECSLRIREQRRITRDRRDRPNSAVDAGRPAHGQRDCEVNDHAKARTASCDDPKQSQRSDSVVNEVA
jgi:hypothetical protein